MWLNKIIIKNVDDISWTDATVCPYIVQNKIDIWKINVSANLVFIDDFLSLLDAPEITRANRYVRVADRNRLIISHGALRIILAKYLNKNPSAIEFVAGINKKPYVVNTGKPPLFYNLSHSVDWILLAVSNSECGADIEFINYDFHYRDILPDYFTDDEVQFIEQDFSTERFFLLWTRKEAFTKATGEGLDRDLKNIPSLDGVHFSESGQASSQQDWSISSFKINGGYIGSVVANPVNNELRFWDINF